MDELVKMFLRKAYHGVFLQQPLQLQHPHAIASELCTPLQTLLKCNEREVNMPHKLPQHWQENNKPVLHNAIYSKERSAVYKIIAARPCPMELCNFNMLLGMIILWGSILLSSTEGWWLANWEANEGIGLLKRSREKDERSSTLTFLDVEHFYYLC